MNDTLWGKPFEEAIKDIEKREDELFEKDLIDENERRLRRGESPLDIDYIKVWHYAQKKIDEKNKPAVSKYVKRNPEQAAKWILGILRKSNRPIDRQRVGSVMAMLDSDLGKDKDYK